MTTTHHTPQVHGNALSDRQLSPQAVALAATMITGGEASALGFTPATNDLALWELNRAGHLGGANA